MVTLDVLIPTRNRARQLARAIESLLAAPVPDGLAVTIVPIDNGSSDGTGALLEWLRALRPLIAQIAWYDRELAKQLRCSSSSVILNTGDAI